MSKVDPFDLGRAQAAVKAAKQRMKSRHQKWRVYELLWRYGDADAVAQHVSDETGNLTAEDITVGGEIVNLLLPHINIIEGSVAARDPKHLAVPVEGGPDAEKTILAAEGVTSYFWGRTGATEKVRDAVRDMVRIGNGFLKSGWLYLEEPGDGDDLGEAEFADDMAVMMEADAVLSTLEGTERLSEDQLADNVPDPDVVVVEDTPYMEYASPYDVFVDEAASSMGDARWVAHRIRLPIEEVQANELYSEAARDDVSANADDGSTVTATIETDQEVHGEFQMATIWEFYDMRARQLLVFQEGAEKALYDDRIPYAHRHPPIIHMPNYRPSGNEFWGFGDIEAVATLQQMYNEAWTEQVDNARRAGTTYLMDESFATADVRSALNSPVGDVIVPVDNPQGIPLDQVVAAVTREPFDQDVYGTKLDSEAAIRTVLGINDFQAGGVGADRMSATAAALVDGVSTIRAEAKAKVVEGGTARAGQILLLLCQEFLDEPRAIRIAGVEGATWGKFSSADIWAEYLVTVEGGSMTAVNPATREKQGVRLLTEILPVIVELGYDPVPVLRQGVRYLGFDPDSLLKELPPEPAPEPAQGQPEGPPQGAEGPPMPPQGGPMPPQTPVPGQGAPADVGVDGIAALMAQLGGETAI